MAVRAKMRVTGIKKYEGQDESREITLQPVYADCEENKSWSRWTPSGEVRMFITNPDAFNQFEQGKSYFVDFTPAE